MSIASEITRLQNAKAALKSSIEAKGVTVDPSATLDNYPELVDSIPTGGGEYEPICFTSLEDGNTFKLNKEISISVDEKQTWQTLAANDYSPEVNAGEKIYFKATENAIAFGGTTGDYYKFTTEKTCNVSGNPYSLYAKGSLYFFAHLFNGTKVVDASGLTLDADIICPDCYNQMFYECTSLVNAPELPATTLASSCYIYMFSRCTSLVTAPKLPATEIASQCYYGMFSGCTSLVNAPELPATTLMSNCYNQMFYECTSLVNAPELPATTLANRCYFQMFQGCTSLITASDLPAQVAQQECYYKMFCECTSLIKAPYIAATTLANACFSGMFYGCSNLQAAPDLLATSPVYNCYGKMFYNCTNLKYINVQLTSNSNSALSDWVTNVPSGGWYIKNPNATWTMTGNSGIPKGWTQMDKHIDQIKADNGPGMTQNFVNAPVYVEIPVDATSINAQQFTFKFVTAETPDDSSIYSTEAITDLGSWNKIDDTTFSIDWSYPTGPSGNWQVGASFMIQYLGQPAAIVRVVSNA